MTESVLRLNEQELPSWAERLYRDGIDLVTKVAADDAVPAYNLAGTLYQSSSGYILLSVPNPLVHGIFSAMREPGIELPPSGPDGRLNAHISVFRKDEVAAIGGADKITERGKQFHYTLGRLVAVEPDGWPEMAKCWMLRVHSPELQVLRRSYGLDGLPDANSKPFHITVAVRRRAVLGRNEKSKGT